MAAFKVDLRRENRFEVIDSRVWKINFNNRDLPFQWVKNLSQDGALIHMGKYMSLKKGDEFPVKVRFMGDTIIQCQGRVIRRKVLEGFINMYEIGVEFYKENPDDFIHSFPERALEEYLEKETLQIEEEEPIAPSPIKNYHIVIASVFFFCVGLISKLQF